MATSNFLILSFLCFTFVEGYRAKIDSHASLFLKNATFRKMRLSGSSCNSIDFALNGVDSWLRKSGSLILIRCNNLIQ